MTVKEIIQNIDTSKDNQSIFDISDLAYHFDWLQGGSWDDEKLQNRLIAYHIDLRYQDGLYIGNVLYLLDNQPVAIEFNGSETRSIKWMSKDTFNETYNYIKTFYIEPEPDNLTFQDINQYVGHSYTLSCHSELMAWHYKVTVTWLGKKVRIINIVDGNGTPDVKKAIYTKPKIMIQLSDGTKKEVLLHEILFPYHTKSAQIKNIL